MVSNRIKLLYLIAKKGHYKDRMYLVNQIASLQINAQHKLIYILLDDPVEVISQTTIKVSQTLTLLAELNTAILEKKEYWISLNKEREESKKAYSKIYKNLPHYKRKFSNGESYQQMKQMLKKSMNIGKWI